MLERGNIILIEKGMQIYAGIPNKFINPLTPFSTSTCSHKIKVGNIYKQGSFTKDALIAEFKKRNKDFFDLEDSKISEIIDKNPNLLTPQELDTSFFEGEYVVLGVYRILLGDLIVNAMKVHGTPEHISFCIENPHGSPDIKLKDIKVIS